MPAELMRAAVLEAPGAPLRIEEIPIPAPQRDEVLVKVAACGACHSDLNAMTPGSTFPTPAVLGHEVSGTVVALGPGVSTLNTGTAVVSTFIMPCGACRFCERERDDLCERFYTMNRLKGTLYDGATRLFRRDGTPLWMRSMGGFAEYSVVPATAVFPLPQGVPLVESAILGCAAFTAFGAVRNAAGLEPGERVAVLAAGGVGSMIVQVARAMGRHR